MEEIRLRTQPRMEKEAIQILLEMAESISDDTEAQSALVYSHHLAPGGFSLILSWETVSVPMQGSDTAMLVLEGLKPLGLLDHTILVETGKQRS